MAQLLDYAKADGIERLYGRGSVARLGAAHVCVVGLGGVGSWAAEALARSGVVHFPGIRQPQGFGWTVNNLNDQRQH